MSYDPSTGQISSNDVPDTGKVSVQSPSGEFSLVSKNNLSQAIAAGYKLDTPELRLEIENQAKYGDEFSALRTAGESALSGATFGLSDLILSKSGLVNREGMLQRRMRNKSAALAGELSSLLIPAAGELALAKGATKTGKALSVAGSGVSTVSRAGHAIEQGVSKLVGESLVGKAVAKSVALGLETEAYHVAHNLSESALQDKELTVDSLLAHSGSALALGAGLGFAIPLGSKLATVAAAKAKNLIDSAANRLSDAIAPAIGKAIEPSVIRAAADASGISANETASMFSGLGTTEGLSVREALLKGVTPEARDALSVDLRESVKHLVKDIEEAKSYVSKNVRPQEVEKLIERDAINPDVVGEQAISLLNSAKNKIAKMRAEPEIYSEGGIIRDLELQIERYEAKLGSAFGSSVDTYKLLNKTKQLLDAGPAKWTKQALSSNPQFKPTVDAARDIAGEFRSALEDSNVWGESGARQAAYNEAFSAHKNAEKEMWRRFGEKDSTGKYKVSSVKVDTFTRQVGSARGEIRDTALGDYIDTARALVEQSAKSAENIGAEIDRNGLESILKKTLSARNVAEQKLSELNRLRALDPLASKEAVLAGISMPGLLGKVQEVSRTLASPSRSVRAVANIEGALLKTGARVEKLTKKIVGGVESTSKLSERLVDRYGPGVSSSMILDRKYERSNSQKSFQKNSEIIKQYSQNTSELARKFESGLVGLEGAPSIKSMVIQKQVNAVLFLASKMPKDPTNASPLNPFLRKWTPSETEMAKFNRYHDAVQNPLGVAEDVMKGTVTREGVETLKTVYPAMYANIVKAISSNLSEIKRELPYSTKRSISILFDIPVESTMDKNFIKTIQSSFRHEENKSQIGGSVNLQQPKTRTETITERR